MGVVKLYDDDDTFSLSAFPCQHSFAKSLGHPSCTFAKTLAKECWPGRFRGQERIVSGHGTSQITVPVHPRKHSLGKHIAHSRPFASIRGSNSMLVRAGPGSRFPCELRALASSHSRLKFVSACRESHTNNSFTTCPCTSVSRKS